VIVVGGGTGSLPIPARHPDVAADRAVRAPAMRATSGDAASADMTDRTDAVLRTLGLSEEEVAAAKPESTTGSTGLAWPPL